MVKMRASLRHACWSAVSRSALILRARVLNTRRLIGDAQICEGVLRFSAQLGQGTMTPGQTVSLGFVGGLRIKLCKAFLKGLNQRRSRVSVHIRPPALKRGHLDQGASGMVQQRFIALQFGRMFFHRPMIIWSSGAQCAELRHTAGSDR